MATKAINNHFRFKGYRFEYNPKRFSLLQKRNLKTFYTPLQKSITQDLGFYPLVIQGEGVLTGDSLMAEYQKLYHLFEEEDSGFLYLPNLTPIRCFFHELTVQGEAGPRYLTYRFTFLEDCQNNKIKLQTEQNYCLAKEGDTLALIACRCGVPLSDLMVKNPALQEVLGIEEGTLVWI